MIYIRDASHIQRVFSESLSASPLHEQALRDGILNVYKWCVARALFDVYLLDIWEQAYCGSAEQFLKYYDQISNPLIKVVGDEFEVTQKFINKRVGISHIDNDLILFTVP